MAIPPCFKTKKASSHKSGLLAKFVAEMVGFEPTCPVKDKTISSRSRYDHFDTSPYSLRASERRQKLPKPLDSPIIITKFPLSVNWFSSASAGYIFRGCAASCKKAAASLRLHLTDAVISGNVSKLGKSLTIWPGSFSRRERFWNEWSRRGRQKRESNL